MVQLMNMKTLLCRRDQLQNIRPLISRTLRWSLVKPIWMRAAVSMAHISRKLIIKLCKNSLISASITTLIKRIRTVPERRKAEQMTTASSWLTGQLLPEEPALTIKTPSSAPCSNKTGKMALSELQVRGKRP